MKHPNSALNAFFGAGVTSCACPACHFLPLTPITLSHWCLWSTLAAASRVQSRQTRSPANHLCRESQRPGAGVSDIPGKGFPAFPSILGFFSHQCSLFTPYCIWQSQEERRRRENQHKVCRGEKRGVTVNVCLSLAGGTAPPWDAGFPAPRAASLPCRWQWGLLPGKLCSGRRVTSGSSHCTERLCRVSLAASPWQQHGPS